MKFPKIKVGIIAGSTLAGAAHGFFAGQPGHRADYAKEGAGAGLAMGVGVVIAPKLAKWAGKKAMESGKVIFRRIHGRIVPIRVK